MKAHSRKTCADNAGDTSRKSAGVPLPGALLQKGVISSNASGASLHAGA